MHLCILASALFSVIVMVSGYRKSNAYTRKQSKILIAGIGIGGLLFWIVAQIPNVYVVQNGKFETETVMEISMLPSETVIESLPLLIFSGISVAIIFMLIQREFTMEDLRLKARWFVLGPFYLGIINSVLFLYANPSVWLVVVFNLLLVMPILVVMWKFFCHNQDTQEQSYEWQMIEAVEREKQELSIYLHDDVLQWLIAFYRKVQSDKSGQYDDTKQALADLIGKIRNVSHNLYPTMVEDLGLEQSLYILVEEMEEEYPLISVCCDYKLQEGIIPKRYALVLYRIAKELVTNAAKHSGGMNIRLLLEEDEGGYYMQVEDNGIGFSESQISNSRKSSHMGLYTVKRQIGTFRGRIDLQSKRNKGTKYDIYIPKQEE